MFPALRYVTQGLKLIPHGILDQKIITERVIYWFTLTLTRGGSRAAATSKMECFVIIVNGCQPLTIITKRSILNVAAALDPPLLTIHCLCKSNQPLFVGNNVKERISRRVFQENKTHQVFAKTNIFYHFLQFPSCHETKFHLIYIYMSSRELTNRSLVFFQNLLC